VQGVTLQGLVIKDTRESFLEDHGTPTGGDWYAWIDSLDSALDSLHVVLF
jgi:hypothetical protein